ncbi:hypothetical protein ACIBOV_29265 [Micromonospora chersina]|uniref:hypothetical protein n=1 Tax=Micromonospora chersina TaxID=47854 RepID=UPI0037AE87D5
MCGRLGWRGPVGSDDMQAVAVTDWCGAAEALTLALEARLDLLVSANQEMCDPRVVEKAVDASSIWSGPGTSARTASTGPSREWIRCARNADPTCSCRPGTLDAFAGQQASTTTA